MYGMPLASHQRYLFCHCPALTRLSMSCDHHCERALQLTGGIAAAPSTKVLAPSGDVLIAPTSNELEGLWAPDLGPSLSAAGQTVQGQLPFIWVIECFTTGIHSLGRHS